MEDHSGEDSAVSRREELADAKTPTGGEPGPLGSTFCTDCGGGPVVRTFFGGEIRLCRVCADGYGKIEMVRVE